MKDKPLVLFGSCEMTEGGKESEKYNKATKRFEMSVVRKGMEAASKINVL